MSRNLSAPFLIITNENWVYTKTLKLLISSIILYFSLQCINDKVKTIQQYERSHLTWWTCREPPPHKWSFGKNNKYVSKQWSRRKSTIVLTGKKGRNSNRMICTFLEGLLGTQPEENESHSGFISLWLQSHHLHPPQRLHPLPGWVQQTASHQRTFDLLDM